MSVPTSAATVVIGTTAYLNPSNKPQITTAGNQVGALTFGAAANSLGRLTIQFPGASLSVSGLTDIGAVALSTGTLRVFDAGSFASNSLIVGDLGYGTVSIVNGGEVEVLQSSNIGLNAGSTGNVNVAGTNSLFQVNNNLDVGVLGTGTISAADGGAVQVTGNLRLGIYGGGKGTATVSGVDGGNTPSKLQVGGTLMIGVSGAGALTISSAGTVSSAGGIVGDQASGNGTATVTGAGSSWTSSSDVNIGLGGTGVLTVDNGGSVSAAGNGVIGYFPGSSGLVTVSGANSILSIGQALFIGGDNANAGNGELVIANGGTVTVNGGAGIVNAGMGPLGGGGQLYIGGYAGAAAAAPGTLDAAEVFLGANGGRLSFNHTSNSYTFAPKISGAGSIEHYAGTTILTADSSAFSGGTTIRGGTLVVNGRLGGVVAVASGGTLGGSGTLTGDVIVGFMGSGTLAPGNSPGTLTIGGNLTLSSTAILNYELGSPSGTAGVNSDLLVVGGNLTLDGTLNVANAGGFGAGLYRLINYGGTLTDNGLLVGTAPAGYSASDLTVQTSTAGQINLIVGAPTVLSFWNGPNTSPNGTVHGGSGDWTPNNTNWTNATGSVSGAYAPSALLIFAGSPGTVTIDKGPSTTGMQFAVDGYIINGEALTLSGAATIRVGDGTSAGAGYTATIASNLIGTGSLNKTDLGTLVLSGNNSYTGGTTVTNGTLVVNGTLVGMLDVLGSGRLQGSGTVGNLAVAGTVAPGNSIGTLNVAGNIGFSAGSIYEVEANAAGQADKILATGAATINGGSVKVLAGAGNYAAATTYTILTAAGGVTGSFTSGVTSNLAFLDPTLSYGPTSVFLTLTRNDTGFGQVGMTRNQISTGSGVESLGAGAAVYDAVLNLSDAQARAAFDQLAGEVHASARRVMVEDSRFAREAAIDRLRAAFDGVGAVLSPVMTYVDGAPVAVAANTDRFALWGRGFGSWGSFRGDANAASTKRDIGGFFLGGDSPVADMFRLGLLGGYSRSSFNIGGRHSSGISDNYHAGLYGGTQWGHLALRAGGAYTWHDLSTSRFVAFPGFADVLKSNYNARTAQVFGEFGYRIDAGRTPFGVLALEPFANLAHVSISTDGFTETGGAAALSGAGKTTATTFTTLGLRASSAFTLSGVTATAKGMVGWRYASGDVTPLSTLAFAGGDPFTIAGVPVARNAAVIEAGLSFNLSPTAALGISYGGQFASGALDQSVKANFDVRF